MTTIAASVAHKAIACDLQFTYGGHTKFKGASKIIALENKLVYDMFGVKKVYIGFSGNADAWGQVVSWFHEPEGKPPACKKIEFLMLTDKNQIYHATTLQNWMMIPEKHFSIGSGCNFAMGAMSSGQTPLEAVKTASKHDVMTGLGFKDYTF